MYQNYKPNFPRIPCFIAYLDALGFRNLVMSETKEDQSQVNEFFIRVLNNEKYFDLEYRVGPIELKYLYFSDSIIIVGSYLNKTLQNKRELFTDLCIAVGHIQLNILRLTKVCLRGGISYGGLYLSDDNKIIFGPALAKAVSLEKKAEFPRVILDLNISQELGYKSTQELIEDTNKISKLGNSNYSNWKSDILFNPLRLSHLKTRPNHLKKDELSTVFIDSWSRWLEGPEDTWMNPVFFSDNLRNGLKGSYKYRKYYNWDLKQLKVIVASESRLKPEVNFNSFNEIIQELDSIVHSRCELLEAIKDKVKSFRNCIPKFVSKKLFRFFKNF